MKYLIFVMAIILTNLSCTGDSNECDDGVIYQSKKYENLYFRASADKDQQKDIMIQYFGIVLNTDICVDNSCAKSIVKQAEKTNYLVSLSDDTNLTHRLLDEYWLRVSELSCY